MKLLATFIPDIRKPSGYFRVSFLREDARTSFGRSLTFASEDAMLRGLHKLGADYEDLRTRVRSWGQGSTWVAPSGQQIKWLHANH